MRSTVRAMARLKSRIIKDKVERVVLKFKKAEEGLIAEMDVQDQARIEYRRAMLRARLAKPLLRRYVACWAAAKQLRLERERNTRQP